MINRDRYPELWITYGPGTQDDTTLSNIIQAGATGVRFTFSYGTPALQEERADQVRRAAERLGKRVLLVADLQGEKCRLAKIDGADEVALVKGEKLVLTGHGAAIDLPGRKIAVQSSAFLLESEPGDTIIEGDGSMVFEVLSKGCDSLTCAPLWNGVIHPGRGLVVRSSHFVPSPLTPKDRDDLQGIANCGKFDAVAVSFVRSESDVQEVRGLLSNGKRKDVKVIAKIETASGLTHAEAIAKTADMLMAARGDLALFLPWVELFNAVRKIGQAASSSGCPWILATQLVEGLERFVFPTRAEICDLAHWMDEGAWGAMLSFETAFGSHPVEAVRCARAIVDRYARK